MSHHFDTETARTEPSLNLCDLYLFAPDVERVAMVMTVHPHVGALASPPLHHEGVYTFWFDVDGDGEPEVAFDVRPEPDGAGRRYQVHRNVPRASDDSARVAGVSCRVDEPASDPNTQLSVFVGPRADPFAADGDALGAFLQAYAEGSFTPAAFSSHENLFREQNVVAIVLEVPTDVIGTGTGGPGRPSAWTGTRPASRSRDGACRSSPTSSSPTLWTRRGTTSVPRPRRTRSRSRRSGAWPPTSAGWADPLNRGRTRSGWRTV